MKEAESREINLKIKKFAGSIEGLGDVYPYLSGLMDIISSGETARANGIKILEVFYKAGLRMIDLPGKLTTREIVIFDDLREMIAVALQRKRMI